MIILASSSPRRQELLRQINCDFRCITSNVVEEAGFGKLPQTIVTNNALAKAMSVAKQYPNEVVLGADTIVAMQKNIYGKPVDRNAAIEMLKSLSGKYHEVYTGLALINKGKSWCEVEKTRVKFATLTESEITDYIDTGEPFDKAGAYAIQGLAAMFVEEIEGCYTNVVGLPLHRFMKLLQKAGIDWKWQGLKH